MTAFAHAPCCDWRGRVAPVCCALLLATPGLGRAEPAPESATTASADPGEPSALIRLVYLGNEEVFLDHGRDRGLAPGQVVQVSRDGRPVGSLAISVVGDHLAAAQVRSAELPLRIGDQVQAPSGPVVGPPAVRRGAAPPAAPPSMQDQARRWYQAVVEQPQPQVASRGAHRSPTGVWSGERAIRGRLATRHLIRSDSDASGLDLQEQRLSVALRVDRLGGLRGLRLDLAGELDYRLDDQADRYREGERFLLRMRELALRWVPDERRGLLLQAGRFRNTAFRGVLDGGAVGWRGETLGLRAWGGLQPTIRELEPRLEAQSFGLDGTIRLTPARGPHWSGLVALAGDAAGGELQRQSLLMNNRLAWDRRFFIDQSVTVALSYLDVAGSRQGPALEDAAVLVRGEPGRRIGWELRARRHAQLLIADETAGLPQEWIEALEGGSATRLDAALEVKLGERAVLRPYAYWHALQPAELAVVAGGLALERTARGGQPVGLLLAVDYGNGWQQQLTTEAQLTAWLHQAFLLVAGLRSTWTQGQDSYLHGFRHLGELRLQAEPWTSVRLWTSWHLLFDHGLGEELEPRSTTYLGQLGAAYRW